MSGPGASPQYSPRYVRLVMVSLWGVLALEIFHRQVLALVLQPMGEELGFSDSGRGSLITAYALTYGLSAPLVARIADRSHRRNLLVVFMTFWGAMTAVCGAVQSHLGLLLARAGVGLGHSASMPCGQALLADYVPPQRRAAAMGFVASGGNVGTLIGLAAWGWVAARFGWRWAFASAGAAGVAYAVWIGLSLREPPRGWSEGRSADGQPPPRMRLVIATLWGLRSFRHVAMAVALAGMGAMAGGQWNPTFLLRVHGLPIQQVGLALAGVTGVVGALGIAAGGLLADRLARRDRRWYAWVPAIGTAASVPLFWTAYLWPSAHGAIAWLAPATLVVMVFGAPASAVIQNLAPLRMRALAAGVSASLMLLLGMGIGPQLTGILSDLLQARMGEHSLRYALALSSLAFVWASFHFAWAARFLRAELARSEAS